MSTVIIARLAAIFAVVAVGYGCGRTRMFAGERSLRLLTDLAFFVFTPALLFRLTASIDLTALPWVVIGVYFGPTVALLLAVYAVQRVRVRAEAAGPSVRAITATFGNTVQLGIPIVLGLFGDPGLAVHVPITSLHAVILLTVLTVLVETDLSQRGGADRPGVVGTALLTARRTVVHPVVLPVLLGLVVNVVGLPIPGPVDEVLGLLGQAVVPLCLVLIGLSLAHYGVRGVAGPVVWLSVGKLVVHPALVLGVGYAAGLRGLALTVVVLCAALPTGSNAQLFAQRYEAREVETTAALMASTLAFAATGPAWLLAVSALA
ncbi:AEC family transporter [Pseudonocardia humida]|uniref:AEC family transporter n=1 Tax=Pseudonocardia humida TaxID=2800819 RepID=A0ABT1A0I8_9PSEU|nr:AEC family transporter [Pseudonocardia humida]MCO1656517.1 AEC family transporter [Pseudonocardia humida]